MYKNPSMKIKLEPHKHTLQARWIKQHKSQYKRHLRRSNRGHLTRNYGINEVRIGRFSHKKQVCPFASWFGQGESLQRRCLSYPKQALSPSNGPTRPRQTRQKERLTGKKATQRRQRPREIQGKMHITTNKYQCKGVKHPYDMARHEATLPHVDWRTSSTLQLRNAYIFTKPLKSVKKRWKRKGVIRKDQQPKTNKKLMEDHFG